MRDKTLKTLRQKNNIALKKFIKYREALKNLEEEDEQEEKAHGVNLNYVRNYIEYAFYKQQGYVKKLERKFLNG